jgi:hypothetical protein
MGCTAWISAGLKNGMGTAIYIATKTDICDFDPFVNGKALGRVDSDVLERLCAEAGVESLLGFISQDPDELTEFLEEAGIDAEGDGEFPSEEWYDPERGLVVVRGLIDHLERNPAALPRSSDVVEDLKEYETVLARLAEKKVPWHFAVDF